MSLFSQGLYRVDSSNSGDSNDSLSGYREDQTLSLRGLKFPSKLSRPIRLTQAETESPFAKGNFFLPYKKAFNNPHLAGLIHGLALTAFVALGISLISVGSGSPDFDGLAAAFGVSTGVSIALLVNYRIRVMKAVQFTYVSKYIMSRSPLLSKDAAQDAAKKFLSKYFFLSRDLNHFVKQIPSGRFQDADVKLLEWLSREISQINQQGL